MEEDIKAFLRIEKLTTGKVEDYSLWQEIPLSDQAVLIGRLSKNPEIVVPDIKIVGDDYISRGNHAEIFFNFKDGCYMILDTQSRHDTFLNRQILEKGKPYALKDRDMIGLARIGNELRVIFRFRLNDDTPPPWDEVDPWKGPPKEGLYIIPASKKVFVDGQQVSLTRTEFKLLEVLYENRGNACSIDDIAYEIWGKDGASNELVAQHIRRLREKIEPDPSKPRYVVVVPGKHGCYRLDL
jgi:hypothetical protein